jgi:hypothetical protein
MNLIRCIALGLGACLAMAGQPALPQIQPQMPTQPTPGQAQAGGGATIKVGSGPHAGRYDFAPTQACVIASLGEKKLPSLSVVLTSEKASLSLDMPSIDEKHANQLQIVLVIAEPPGAGHKGTASVTYEIDTRPDSVLEPFQKAERANKGVSGTATTQLMERPGVAMLSFSGETKNGVKLSGEITCRKM